MAIKMTIDQDNHGDHDDQDIQGYPDNHDDRGDHHDNHDNRGDHHDNHDNRGDHHDNHDDDGEGCSADIRAASVQLLSE